MKGLRATAGGRVGPKPLQRKDLGRSPVLRKLKILAKLMHEHRDKQKYNNVSHVTPSQRYSPDKRRDCTGERDQAVRVASARPSAFLTAASLLAAITRAKSDGEPLREASC